MTRKLHDAFAKECLQELLADFGRVEVEQPIAGEVRTVDTVDIDVWSAGFRPLGACPQTPIGGQLSPPNPLQTKPWRGSPGLALGLAKMRLIEDSLFS
jgi:hypothetical protein